MLSLLLFACTSMFLHSADAFTTNVIHPMQKHCFSRPQVSYALSASSGRQILEFQEPQTNVTVVLVGAMHYNPSSINLAKTTIQDLAFADRLGSVIVESCDIRWNKALEYYERRPWLKSLLKNEMMTSCKLAQEYNCPVILGDQRINITTAALKATLKETFVDLISPPSGWKRFATEVSKAWEDTVPFGGQGYLGANAFFDPRLLLDVPVSFVKYPLSYMVRDPLPTSVVLIGILALNYFDGSSSVTMDAVSNNQVPLSDYLVSFGLAALETVFFARLLLKPLLADRNEILAKSILDQCRLLATGETDLASKRSSTSEIVYAPGSAITITEPRGDKDQAVVAILGMAHCNGIKKLLQEQTLLLLQEQTVSPYELNLVEESKQR
jgi:hypothetical protein